MTHRTRWLQRLDTELRLDFYMGLTFFAMLGLAFVLSRLFE